MIYLRKRILERQDAHQIREIVTERRMDDTSLHNQIQGKGEILGGSMDTNRFIWEKHLFL